MRQLWEANPGMRKIVAVLVALPIVLAGCASHEMEGWNSQDGEAAEALEMEYALDRSMLLLPDDGWRLLAPGVWGRTAVYPDGSYRLSRRASGVNALSWHAQNEWLPRLEAIDAELGDQGDSRSDRTRALASERSRLLARLDVLEEWQGHASKAVVAPQQCSATAAATAGPTTAGPGAKASSRARTCTTWTSRATAAAEPPFSQQVSFADPGKTATASKTAYGTPRSSAADAYGYPEYADDYYHC